VGQSMEVNKSKTLTHLLLSGYTIGFVLGGLAFFMAETNLQFSVSKESIFYLIFLTPIIYWVYRYSGMVFNNQNFKIKLYYIVIFLFGMAFGIIFFELILN